MTALPAGTAFAGVLVAGASMCRNAFNSASGVRRTARIRHQPLNHMKALSKEWAESKLPNEDGQEIGAGCPAFDLLGVSRFALDRAMSALEYQVRSVKESPHLDGDDMMGVLLREGLKNSQKALDEVRAALFA